MSNNDPLTQERLMTNHLHYIEHTHQAGYGILTKFTCKGDRTSPCHQYPDCGCEYWNTEHEREHPSVPHDQCWFELWMDDADCAEVCCPDGEPVQSGPITVTFNGDCVEWEYVYEWSDQ